MVPKKLIREKTTNVLKAEEWEIITDKEELNRLYVQKVKEELNEIEYANFKDITEYADLIQVVVSFAIVNDFTYEDLFNTITEKATKKGTFNNTALINLNPENPSNKIYFNN